MSTLPEDDRPSDPIDPADPAYYEKVRLRLTRRLLRSAVRSYRDALAFTVEVNVSTPAGVDNEPREERQGWKDLRGQADEAFDAAEVTLAARIVNLYEHVAPRENRLPTRDDDVFMERAIRADGVIFVVTYDPADYQPETSIVAMLDPRFVIDLDD